MLHRNDHRVQWICNYLRKKKKELELNERIKLVVWLWEIVNCKSNFLLLVQYCIIW